tara:strand:+ start:1157 stop:1840 length:684 start_codon:yes stop_codon:yes gene_type:complete
MGYRGGTGRGAQSGGGADKHAGGRSGAAAPVADQGPCPDAAGGLRQASAACGAADQATERPRRLDFSDLDLPECLLIKPIRLWLHGPENWTLVGMQYRAHFGDLRTTRAMVALRGVIETLNAGGRRMMHFHKAWKRTTTGDERALVALAAAVQAADGDRARAMALRLVGLDWQQPLLDDMAALTGVFAARGHRFVHLPPRGPRQVRSTAPIRIARATPPRQAPASRQ